MLNGTLELPDEIWVGDQYAEALARTSFPNTIIRLVPNQYFVDTTISISEAESKISPHSSGKTRVLYVCEPRTMKYDNPNYWGYTEYEALDGYLNSLTIQSAQIDEVRVRLHPSESPGKYDAVISKYENRFIISESVVNPLYDDCAWADWVVGCDSMAMVIGLMAKKKVFSCIPRGGRKMSLPFHEITRLFTQDNQIREGV
jgi:hypothetical protein